ncbi:MAG: hypothetical protein HYZ25_13920 [Chloroflexi bacterium]|nr:hypothetical protein [Chloroflexota bacterium]
MTDPAPSDIHPASSDADESSPKKRILLCDRCGAEMYERNCKVICPNCGNRFDCSDLNIYFD